MDPIPWLAPAPDYRFPPLSRARDEHGGLLAAGGDLSVGRLLAAYARGIYPWYGADDPILWWSPDPRMVLRVADFHLSHSLARRMRTAGFELRMNSAFADVLCRCAEPRPGQDGTWIVPEMSRPPMALASRRVCAFSRDLARRRVGGRAVWRGDRAHVFWRVDVYPDQRCLEGRAGASGRTAARGRYADDRLPAADRASGIIGGAAGCAARVRRAIGGSDPAGAAALRGV